MKHTRSAMIGLPARGDQQRDAAVHRVHSACAGHRSVFVAIPCKSFASGKSRLGAVMCPAERSSLARSMLRRTIDIAHRAVEPTWLCVVTASEEVAEFAETLGCGVLRQAAESGLNDAAGAAVLAARDIGADALTILPIDLPLMQPDDLDAALRSLGPAPAVSLQRARRDRGTNLLITSPPGAVPFRYGADSYRAHLAEAKARGITPARLNLAGLALDLDTPEDLGALDLRGMA